VNVLFVAGFLDLSVSPLSRGGFFGGTGYLHRSVRSSRTFENVLEDLNLGRYV
jgi:hypothetical protein